MNAVLIIVGVLVGVAITTLGARNDAHRSARLAQSARPITLGGEPGDNASPFSMLPLLAGCDPCTSAGRLIWRTQIPALETVCCHEPRGTYFGDLKPLYFELARCFPEIFDGYCFQTWGQVMLDLGLFRVEGKQIHITAAGRALLGLLGSARSEFRDVAPEWVARLKNV